ncbi:hypothetical protein LINGRAHAP2_LOCUS31512 [Linum grandiflorum]
MQGVHHREEIRWQEQERIQI